MCKRLNKKFKLKIIWCCVSSLSLAQLPRVMCVFWMEEVVRGSERMEGGEGGKQKCQTQPNLHGRR